MKEICLLFYLSLAVVSISLADTGTDKIKQSVSHSLSYPAEKLTVTLVDRAQILADGGGELGAVQRAYEIKSSDPRFSKFRVYVLSNGSPAFDQMEAFVEKSKVQVKGRNGGRGLPEKLLLGDRGVAYSASMGGPGGQQNIIYARMDKSDLDLVLSMFISADVRLKALKEGPSPSEKYDDLMSNGGAKLSSLLGECVLAVENAYLSQNHQFSPPVGTQSVTSMPTQNQETHASSGVSQEDTLAHRESFSTPRFLIPVGIITVLALAGSVFYRLYKK